MSKIRVNTVVNRTSNDKVTFPFGIGVTNGVVCSGVVTATAFVGSGVSLTGVKGAIDLDFRDSSGGYTGITTITVGTGLTVTQDATGIGSIGLDRNIAVTQVFGDPGITTIRGSDGRIRFQSPSSSPHLLAARIGFATDLKQRHARDYAGAVLYAADTDQLLYGKAITAGTQGHWSEIVKSQHAGIVTFTSGGVNVSAGGDGVNSDRLNVSGVGTITDLNVSNNLQVTGITTLGDTVVNSAGEVIIQNLDRVMMGGVDGSGAPIGFVARYNSGTATELSNISGLPFVFGDGNVTDFATISVGGIDVGTGVVTATAFDGELSGSLSGSINASGISTIQNLHITDGLLATGVSIGTVRTLQSETVFVSGVATATSFDGPSTGLTGTPNVIVGHSTHHSIVPSADDTYDLGANDKRWANIYSADMHFSNKGASNSVDGTWGDWTLQEGENDIFMLNNRTGKKFKINLTEV